MSIPVEKVSSISTKVSKDTEYIESDRIALLQEANKLIEHISIKQILPKALSGYQPEIELTEPERTAYNAALSFLADQFQKGPRDGETYISQTNQEESISQFDPKEPEDK